MGPEGAGLAQLEDPVCSCGTSCAVTRTDCFLPCFAFLYVVFVGVHNVYKWLTRLRLAEKVELRNVVVVEGCRLCDLN